MMSTLTRPTAQVETHFPFRWFAVAGLGSFWIVLAAAETVIGELDSLDDVAAMAEGSARIATAGLLHVLTGVLLLVALVGLAPLVWRSRIGRVGWSMSALAAGCFGCFGMLHLLALETAADGLDAAAMNEFLVERLGGFGVWGVPVIFVALLGPWAVALLLVGLARVREISWLPSGVLAVGALVHMVGGVEVASHWVMAAGAVLAAVELARGRAVRS